MPADRLDEGLPSSRPAGPRDRTLHLTPCSSSRCGAFPPRRSPQHRQRVQRETVSPDRHVDRRPEPGRRDPGRRRAHQVHRFGGAQEPAQRAGGRAACWRSARSRPRARTGRPAPRPGALPRRTCWAAWCSTAADTPAPSAAAALAAVSLGNTRICCPAPGAQPESAGVAARISRGRVDQPAPLLRAALRRGCPAPTTTRRYLNTGSLTTGSAGSAATSGPMARSASRLAAGTPISLVIATPAVASTGRRTAR